MVNEIGGLGDRYGDVLEGISLESVSGNKEDKAFETIDVIEEYRKSLNDIVNTDDSEIRQILDKHRYTLDLLFFNKSDRFKRFNELKDNIDNVSHDEILTFLYSEGNKILSKDEWKKLLSTGILNWSLQLVENPNIEDRIKILSEISYYSLQNCLRVGIDTGLFLQNAVKLFPKLKDQIIEEFSSNFALSGGLALTEVSSGSDLLTNFDTTYIQNEDGTYTIEGTKHLQGLTNEATHWIVLAKQNGGRKFRYFMIDTRNDLENVEMIEEYKMRALKGITYGVNSIKATVSADAMSDTIERDPSGVRTLASSLYDSRLQFPAMASGYLERLYDESLFTTHLRKISNGPMINNESVTDKLYYIKAYSDTIKTINEYLTLKKVDLFANNDELEELSIICKALSTEYMLLSGNKARDLQGGFGLREDNIISNLTDDAWAFSRFEGVNEMLYSKLSEIYIVNKDVKGIKNILEIRKLLTILIDNNISVSKIVESDITDENKGKIYARIEVINMLLITNSYKINVLTLLVEEIKQLLCTKNKKLLFNI